jgi:hypothetical protein
MPGWMGLGVGMPLVAVGVVPEVVPVGVHPLIPVQIWKG